MVNQAIHPFNNPYLLTATDKQPPSRNLRWLGNCFELRLGIGSYLQQLTSLEQRINLEEPTQPNFLERSIISWRSDGFQKDATQPSATFLKEMGLELIRHLDVKSIDQHDQQEVRASLSVIIRVTHEIIRAFSPWSERF